MKITSFAAMALTFAITSAANAELSATQPQKSPADQTLVSPAAAQKVDQADLIERLLGGNPAVPGDLTQRLDTILKRMASAETLLKNQDPGEVTLETLHRITDDLDLLIEEAKKQENQPGSQNPRAGTTKPDPQNQPGRPSRGPSKPGNSDQAAINSNLRNGDADAAPGNPNLLISKDEPWKNLPPVERRRITIAMQSDVLPEYKDTMQKFFDELAKSTRTAK